MKYAVILLLALIGCTPSVEKNEQPSVKDAKSLETKDQSTMTSVQSADKDVRIFDKFDQMEFKLKTNSDTTYVVNFWATWCKPCVKELPYFEELNATEKFDKPVKVVLISLDEKKFVDNKVIPLLVDKKIQSEAWLLDDPKYNDWIDKVSAEWSGAIPATLVFNKTKRQFEEADFSTYNELQNFISQFLEG